LKLFFTTITIVMWTQSCKLSCKCISSNVSKDTKDASFKSITRVSIINALLWVTKYRLVSSWSSWLLIIDRHWRHSSSRCFTARVTTISEDRYQRISVFVRMKSWCGWGSLFEAGATERDFLFKSHCFWSLQRPLCSSHTLPALRDWTTEADPLTITELSPFRRFPS